MNNNPYKLPAGDALDQLVAEKLFGRGETVELLPYSTDEKAAEKVRSRVQSLYGHAVVVGRTRLARYPYFARFESGPSTSTEVLAETGPLAICRLAMVVAGNREK